MTRANEFQETLDDSELLKWLALCLDDYFHLLVRKYERRLLAYAFRNVRHWHDAQDIVQETFVRAYQSLTTFPQERILQLKLSSWLFTITYNLCINQLTRNTALHDSIDRPETRKQFEDTAKGQDGSPEDVILPRQDLEALYTLLSQLPGDYREAIALYYIGGLTDAEVAEVRAKPRDTVKSHRLRGVHKLREMCSRPEEFQAMRLWSLQWLRDLLEKSREQLTTIENRRTIS
jgi:RNA polymerase sigma-70 factor (ECF subfamily)